MQTKAMINAYNSFSQLVKKHPDHFTENDKNQLHELLSYCVEGMDNDSQKFVIALILQALNKKLNSYLNHENIYLKQYEISQIQLFNILIEKFPFVNISQKITNQAILDLMKQHEEVTIIDIGIGQGTQMMNILAQSKSMTHLKKLTIVGIEPAQEALDICKANLDSVKTQYPCPIEFIQVCGFAEATDFSKFKNQSDCIIVNASLALHHIQTNTARQETIRKIKELQPAAFLLIEPNVNHYEADITKRIHNCYHHFFNIFRVIDRIDILQEEKNALKQFFGREIEDIIGKPETDRYEKHDLAIHWIKNLSDNQFSIQSEFAQLPDDHNTGLKIQYHKEGFLGFTFDRETILAVIYAN